MSRCGHGWLQRCHTHPVDLLRRLQVVHVHVLHVRLRETTPHGRTGHVLGTLRLQYSQPLQQQGMPVCGYNAQGTNASHSHRATSTSGTSIAHLSSSAPSPPRGPPTDVATQRGDPRPPRSQPPQTGLPWQMTRRWACQRTRRNVYCLRSDGRPKLRTRTPPANPTTSRRTYKAFQPATPTREGVHDAAGAWR